MTGEQEEILADFELKVRQLMQLCGELRRENAGLKTLTTGQIKEIERLTEDKKQLQSQYENLKTARIIEVRQGDFASAKQRIDNLVNEIDGCIRLLKE